MEVKARTVLLPWLRFESETWPANNPLLVENNIFYDFRTSVYGDSPVDTDAITSGTNNWTFNYNDYYTPLSTIFYINGTGSLTFGNMRSAAWELNGQTNSPTFQSLSFGSGKLAYQNNYSITNGNTVGAGVNLSGLNLPGLNHNFNGQTNGRPESGRGIRERIDIDTKREGDIGMKPHSPSQFCACSRETTQCIVSRREFGCV